MSRKRAVRRQSSSQTQRGRSYYKSSSLTMFTVALAVMAGAFVYFVNSTISFH
jgi:hypothetical protein